MWIAATPARSNSRNARMTCSGSPKPVAASTISGTSMQLVIRLAASTTSVMVINGSLIAEADPSAWPPRAMHSKPSPAAIRAVSGSKQAGATINPGRATSARKRVVIDSIVDPFGAASLLRLIEQVADGHAPAGHHVLAVEHI